MKTFSYQWILWNTDVHYCVHKRPPLALVMIQIIQIHKMHINSIVPSVPSLWSGFFTFPTKILYNIHLFSVLCPRSIHRIFLDLISPIIFGDEYKSWRYLLCWFLQSLITSSLVDPNIVLSTLVPNTPSLCSSLHVMRASFIPTYKQARV